MKCEPNALFVTEANARATSLDVTSVQGNQISVSYRGMPGNRPNTFGNFLSIWQNSNSIPFGTPPLQTKPIVGNTPDGSQVFTDLDVTNNSYIVGYSTGPLLTQGQPYGNICATDFVPASSGGESTPFVPSLKITNIGANSVALSFQIPAGITGVENGAWAALWQSSVPSYNNPPVSNGSVPIGNDGGFGSIAFNGVNILRGFTYTVGLFMSGYERTKPSTQTALACSITFTN